MATCAVWRHQGCQSFTGKPQTQLCAPRGRAGGSSPCLGQQQIGSATALKKCCLLLGRAGGSGESQRTPAEILYSWGRLAFSTRQEPLPCSNIPSLPLGEPADEISIAVTLDQPFPGAWEGGRAAPGAKRGCRFPKASPGWARGCLRAGVMGDAVGDAHKSFKVSQVPSRGPSGLFPALPQEMRSPQPTFTALTAPSLERPKYWPQMSLLGSSRWFRRRSQSAAHPLLFPPGSPSP